MTKTRRSGTPWIPNQHGAWAMLAAPFIAGVAVGGATWWHLLLGVWWLVAYCAFFAVSQWLKSRRRAVQAASRSGVLNHYRAIGLVPRRESP